MDVTATPQCLRMTPREEATTPFPIPEITPPVTRMYFILSTNGEGRGPGHSETEARDYLD
jgi:hypothetical protein